MVIMLGFESGGPGSNLCQNAIKELTKHSILPRVRTRTPELNWPGS